MSFRTFLFLALAILLTRALNAAPSQFETLLGKGDALDAQGQCDGALACYREAEKLAPRNVDLLCRISKQYHDAMADAPSRDAMRERCRLALSYAERAAALDPQHGMAEALVAVSYGRLARLVDTRTKANYSREVERHARRALELQPDNDVACYVLGAWNLELANLSAMQRRMAKWIYGGLPAASNAEAERCLNKAISLNPTRASYFVELGRVYAATGRTKEARATLEKALSMPPPGKDDPRMKERAEKALKKLK